MALNPSALVAARQRKGWSQARTAREAGINQSYYSQLEKQRKTNPSDEVVVKLAAALGCMVEQLAVAATEEVRPPRRRPKPVWAERHPTYAETDDATDPCALCVQWRLIDPDNELGSDWEPYWPDGSVVPRIWRGTHADCQAAVDAMHEEQA